MPIEELLKLYGYSSGGSQEEEDGDVQEEDSSENNCSSHSKLKVKIYMKTKNLYVVVCINIVNPSNHYCGFQEDERQEDDQENQEDEDVQSSGEEPPSCSVSHSTAQLLYPRPSNYLEGMIIKRSHCMLHICKSLFPLCFIFLKQNIKKKSELRLKKSELRLCKQKNFYISQLSEFWEKVWFVKYKLRIESNWLRIELFIYIYIRGVTIHRYIDTMYDDTMHRCHV